MAEIDSEDPLTKLPNADEDDEDDYSGYFLEPTPDDVNMAEKIAEANRKLYEEDGPNEDPERPKKVQFSESLVNFEPENSDDSVRSNEASTITEEEAEESEVEGESEKNKTLNRQKTAVCDAKIRNEEEAEKEAEEVEEEITTVSKSDEDGDSQQAKILLVMLPREQSSSCESVIGEEVPETPEEPPAIEIEEVKKVEESPKAAKPNRIRPSNPCKMSKVTPDLNFFQKVDTNKWRKQRLKPKKPKQVPIEKTKQAMSERIEAAAGDKPKAATVKRSCCVLRTGLPQYNGLRSEYGLSAEQLQERKRKTFEMRQQKRLERLKKRQEELRKRLENEQSFSRWLHNKRSRPTEKRPILVDTLSRSDVYIQCHAAYATSRSVPYSVEYGAVGKKHPRSARMVLLTQDRPKIINLERLFERSPSEKQTYRIYLDGGE